MADVEIGKDLFTDTAGTNLGSHTPNVGSSWTIIFNAFLISVGGDSLRATAPAIAQFNTVSATPNNQRMRITGGTALNSPLQFAVACRTTGSATDLSDFCGYWMQRDLSGNLTLYSVTNGSFSVIASAAADPNSPSGTVYEISANGTTIETKSGASVIHSVTDATWASGEATIYCAAAGDVVFDDFYLYEIVADGGQPTMRRWGGVPFMGGQGIGQKGSAGGSGRAWGKVA